MARMRDRQATLEAIGLRMKEVSRLSLLFSEAMASRLGVSMSDLECLDLVASGSNVTAGALAERTGLTTGAITGAIDRLERAGFVERRKDEADRRKVIVAGKPATRRAHPSSEKMRRAIRDVLECYDDDELAFLDRVLGELCDASKVVIEKMRAEEENRAGSRQRAPARQPKAANGRRRDGQRRGHGRGGADGHSPPEKV